MSDELGDEPGGRVRRMWTASRRIRRRFFAAAALILVVGGQVAWTGHAIASARPGGGGSFSGGSGSSSSSSSGGGSRSGSSSSGGSSSGWSSSGSHRSGSSASGGLRVGSSSERSSSSGASSGGGTSLGVPLLCMLGIVLVLGFFFRSPSSLSSWSTAAPSSGWPSSTPPPHLAGRARRRLLALRLYDPNFSLVLFDDFLVALYTEIKTAQGRGQLARYQPYLSAQALSALGSPGGAITSVIVGSASIEDVDGPDPSSPRVTVRVVFETNYGVHDAHGETARYAREEWLLSRRRDARSRTPDNARVIGCPNCGAPLDVVVAGVCGHCQSNVTGGTFDWLVQTIEVVGTEARGPMLTSDVQESGTELPTVVEPSAAAGFAALESLDSTTNWDTFSLRVNLIFTSFQTAWAGRDLLAMRPFMSDALFATQTFWVEEYRRQGLRNITEDARIHRLELANVTQDAFFDAVTVRVHASSLDYTLRDADDLLVCGSRTKPRRYTEYWTLIRGRGRPSGRAPSASASSCPNCGAPLDVSMAGDCNYCRVKVTTGRFDWVLSRIEQDEVYRG